MTFYERYEIIAKKGGIDPCSAQAAKMIKTTKSAPSMWKKNGTAPKGETVAAIADAFHVSADYLLGRTDDSTDYCKLGTTKTPSQPDPVDTKTPSSTKHSDALYQLCDRLDASDRLKVQGVIQGLLMHDKYM